MFLRKKYKQCKEDVVSDVKQSGVETCILKIDLKATSKIKNHFIYEVCYLDDGELKQVPIVSDSILGVIKTIKPYVNKGISEHQTEFLVGTEEAVASRKESKTYSPALIGSRGFISSSTTRVSEK